MLDTSQILDKIFKDPKTRYELTEFENLGRPVHQVLTIYPKTITSGRESGKTKYFLKSFIPFSSGKEEVQVYSDDGKAAPEEIVRQLWVYKLIHQYDYKADQMELEKSVQFGTEIGTKAADIVVYTNNTKITPKIIIETKKPKRKDGIEQLKSYLNAEGSPVGVWSNGSDRIILYRPYPREFDDTLYDIPKKDEQPQDVLEKKKTLLDLRKDFNFKKIVQDLEELVLADSGVDEFNEIFKLIFAKIWDEKEAEENRANKKVEFSKAIDPEITYERINKLFHKAMEEWPGVFDENENIKLRKDHLQVCIGPIEGVRLLGSNLRIMDDAFEYLLPTEAKKKKGQFFTPRHVVEMCVRMLNPKKTEFVMDPACGSASFLLHAMNWCYPADSTEKREQRKHRYASKYLWGIDFEARAAKTSRALMLIAGDGHTNIFGPDVNSLDPTTWYATASGQQLMQSLRNTRLLVNRIPANDPLNDEEKAWDYFHQMKFDVVLANPPFAGEVKDKKMLAHYDLARPALKRAKNKAAKEERDVLFIERILRFVKPGGRAAIVLPQGKFNNSSLAFIREWILRKARLLAVVGLHPNTFKPHTGTKTSVLFVQKYTDDQLSEIETIQQQVADKCPDYAKTLQKLLKKYEDQPDIPEEAVPEDISELILENFAAPEQEPQETEEQASEETEQPEILDLDEQIEKAQEAVASVKNELIGAKQKLADLQSQSEALQMTQTQEIEVITASWKGTKKELKAHLKPITDKHKKALKDLAEANKDTAKKLKSRIKALEKAVPDAEAELKMLTTKGKLQLILEDPDLIAALKERWISEQVAEKLDYPIFMAVSERGGKDNSGQYKHILNEDGNYDLDDSGHPMVDQDLVNYTLDPDDLNEAAKIPDNKLCIAEAFVRFAQKHDLDFWRVD